MSRSERLAEAILRDRKQAVRKPAATKEKIEGSDFDPFASTQWRIIAGKDAGLRVKGPGYLVKTPMRTGPVGWFIDCQCCRVEFESLGLAFCPTCMELPAEQRRANKKAFNDSNPRYATRHGLTVTETNKASPQKSGTENIEEFPPLFGSADFPRNLVDGFRRGRRLPPGLADSILEAEVGPLRELET